MKLKTNKLLLSSAILASMTITTVAQAVDLTITDNTPQLIFDDTTTAGLEWQLYSNASFFGLFNDIDNHYVWSVNGSSNSAASLAIDTSGDINLANGSVFVDRSENRLGIGTSAPNQDLHINSSSSSSGIRMQNTSSNWYMLNGGAGLYTYRTSPNSSGGGVVKLLNDAPANSIVADDMGVGIGTSSPQTALHVRKSGAKLRITDTNGASGIRNLLEMENNGPVGFELSDTSDTPWAFRTGGGGSFIATKTGISGPMLSMAATGSVSLGQNPAVPNVSNMTLTNTGNLIIKGAFYTPVNSYADYVFESDYKLMPLDELQQFIKKEKHLPNVLSEAEVRKTNSINVSELQITQLAKIEELTLYTLQQHQQIKDLRESNTVMQKQLKDQTIALQASSKQSDEQTMAMKSENNRLQQRLASLEKLVTNLASGEGILPNNGHKVVLNK